MKKKIKIVWAVTILSSIILIAVQGYWLYSQYAYSLNTREGELVKVIEHSIKRYEDQRSPKNNETQLIGYAMTACIGPDSVMVTTVSSPHVKENYGILSAPKSIKIIRDTFLLPEISHDIAFDMLTSHITQLRRPFNKIRYDMVLKSCLGGSNFHTRVSSRSVTTWKSIIKHPVTVLHPYISCYVPYDPLTKLGIDVTIPVYCQPLLKKMGGQLLFSAIVTILLLLSFIYQILVIINQKRVADLRNDFVHTMIHELKRPVQTLKMCVSLIADSGKRTDPERMNTVAAIITDEVDNLTAYINKLRDVVKTVNQIPLSITSFSLKEMLEHQIALYNKTNTKKVEISLFYERESDIMYGDEMQLANVVSNLLENSVKYSGDPVHVKIACADDDDMVKISIADDGFGIEPSECRNVFKKFYRGHSISKDMMPGMGLGLSYVQLVVKAHDGNVSLQSVVSKGTTVTINIPQQ